jgi:hypothetical protein
VRIPYTLLCTLLGFVIGWIPGITVVPRAWWARGSLCGFVMMLPPSLVALATPGCGFR